MRASLPVLHITAGLLCFALTAQAQSSGAVAEHKAVGSIYITHVTVIDTESGKEKLDQTVVISGERIYEILTFGLTMRFLGLSLGMALSDSAPRSEL